MSFSAHKPIGGYFGLEMPKGKRFLYEKALFFRSARVAFYLLLKKVNPTLIWMPAYICPSMIEVVKTLGINFKIYHINEDFEIIENINLYKNEILLYVNYFGICAKNQLKILKKYNSNQVIFDNSQALFSEPLDCLATLYSPRKFLGIPDGGVLITKLDILQPDFEAVTLNDLQHLICRYNGKVKEGYKYYLINEEKFNNFEHLGVTGFSYDILHSVSYDTIKNKRLINFKYLKKSLTKINKFKFDNFVFEEALFLPFLGDVAKNNLINNNIFVPTYWPNIEFKLNDFEKSLIENLICIPCDHRYSKKDLSKVVDFLKSTVNELFS